MSANYQGKRGIASKMTKTELLLRSEELTKHIPTTHWLGLKELTTLMDRHRMVYVKPDRGSKGIGVMRVKKTSNGYELRGGTRTFKFSSLAGLFRSLQVRIGDTPYLVQKGIHALKQEGRPYDFRVMIQRNSNRKWECTGTAARVAHPDKIVSNGSQGGTIYSPARLLVPVCGEAEFKQLQEKMNRLALLTAAELSKKYPQLNELGLDLAVDKKLKPWILEVNTRPDPCPFTKLDDPTIIRRIVQYAKGYGRHYTLNCNKAKKAP
ncbi:YheC/YheD family protein [Paenibacillus pasadenensis]|uniref:YheC/YheD family protein n=1 Tax=Paenibacillus pasadenensis TaxID=217090 RepID=UPI00203C1AA3|nr:YheC/YheD family protein [Paenibacillus pasadenensis]MCM3748113.1 YheC/YheD family protein [Paenibacillus pasadenensis]